MTQEEKKKLVIKAAKATEQMNTAVTTAESASVKLLADGTVDSYDLVKIGERVGKYIVRASEALAELNNAMTSKEAQEIIPTISEEEAKSSKEELRELVYFILGDKLEDYTR